MNVVRKVEDNDEPNGIFWVYLALQLLPGTYPIDLLQFQAIYWANGRPCLNLEPTLKIGDEMVKMMGDEKSLKQPIRLHASGISLQYSRCLRPPLRKHIPEECELRGCEHYLVLPGGTQTRCHHGGKALRFLPGGKLEPILEIRPVPRLTDEQLKSCYEEGGIDEVTFDRLMNISPVARYMGARSDVGENFVPNNVFLLSLSRC